MFLIQIGPAVVDEKQLFTPLVQHNPAPARALIDTYQLNLDRSSPDFVEPGFYQTTILGQRRALADILRLQFYGPLWAATGIDQDIVEDYEPRAEDLEAVEAYYGLEPPIFSKDEIAFEVVEAGVQLAGDVPILLVNEPMFISMGENSDLRYNFFYPRWAYDQYRQVFSQEAAANGWHYIDLWQAVDNSEYTNSAIHLTPKGSAQLAEALLPVILEIAQEQ